MAYPKGEAHPNAKLSDDEVRTIRALASAGIMTGEISKTFGITRFYVLAIVKGKARASA